MASCVYCAVPLIKAASFVSDWDGNPVWFEAGTNDNAHGHGLMVGESNCPAAAAAGQRGHHVPAGEPEASVEDREAQAEYDTFWRQ